MMVRLFVISLTVGLSIGSLVALCAHLFVQIISTAQYLGQQDYFGSGGYSIFNHLTPFLWLLGGFLLVRLIAKLFQVDKWQGPADAIYMVHRADGTLAPRQGLATMLAALASLGGGASLGQYGPIVHMGALFGSLFQRLSVRATLSNDVFVGCGVAAAISAGCQAPIAGIIFAHEAVLRHFSARAIAPIAIASITASALSSWLFGSSSFLQIDIGNYDLLMVVPALLMGGVLFALIAIMLMASQLKLAGWLAASRFSVWQIGLAGVFLLGIIATAVPETLGLGMSTISAMLDGQYPVSILAVFLIAKILAVLIASSFGFVGGFVSPALFIGAAAGGMLALCLNMLGFDISVLLLMVAGMAALSATIVGAPIAMVMLVFELTHSYDFAVAAMLSVVVATFLSHISFGHSLFDQQLAKRNIDISKGRGHLELSARNIKDIITQNYLGFSPQTKAGDVLHAMVKHQQTEAYCIDEQGQYVGKLMVYDLVRAKVSETAGSLAVADQISLTVTDNLQQAIERAANFVGETIPVLTEDSHHIAGVVTEGDLFAAYLDCQRDIQRIEHG